MREAIREVLPFHPTKAQKRALGEIVADMRSSSPMRRLLQGDVGSGETIVALQAMLVAMENGYQAALMAPTEILATQHFLSLRKLLDKSSRRFRIVLLTGSLSEDRKRATRGVDLALEKKHGDFVRGLIEAGRVDTCHDLSDGGVAVALAEMALAGAGIGASVGQASLADATAFWFGEDQGRYLIAAPFAEAEKIVAEARDRYISVAELGKTGGDALVLDDKDRLRGAGKTSRRA